jgi:hypothetical protein
VWKVRRSISGFTRVDSKDVKTTIGAGRGAFFSQVPVAALLREIGFCARREEGRTGCEGEEAVKIDRHTAHEREAPPSGILLTGLVPSCASLPASSMERSGYRDRYLRSRSGLASRAEYVANAQRWARDPALGTPMVASPMTAITMTCDREHSIMAV